MRHLRHVAVVVLLTALALAVRTTSYADSQTTKDATRDVYKQGSDGIPRLDPTNRKHDIVRAGAVYRGTVLKLWVEVRRLGSTAYIANWDVKTPDDRWALHYDKREGPAYTSLFHGFSEVLDCGGLRGRALPRQDRVVVTVPRACIERPRWIRFGSSFGHDTDSVIYIDDARIDAGYFTNRARLGPRLRHS